MWNTVNGIKPAMPWILHVGFKAIEFILRCVLLLHQGVIAFADQSVYLFKGDSQSLPRNITSESRGNFLRVSNCRSRVSLGASCCRQVWPSPCYRPRS
jgi:hypothetical protein